MVSSPHDYKIFNWTEMNQTETNEFKKHKQNEPIFNLSFHKLNTEKTFSKLAHNYYNLTDINKNTNGR